MHFEVKTKLKISTFYSIVRTCRRCENFPDVHCEFEQVHNFGTKSGDRVHWLKWAWRRLISQYERPRRAEHK